MSLNNLASVSFTTAELSQLDNAINSIATVLEGKTFNLTPEQRQNYSRINEQNKLFVNKAKTIMEQNPQLVPVFINKGEYDKDYDARVALEQRLMQLKSLSEQMSDTKILLDHDNYHDSITFFRNIKYLAGENVPGTTSLYQEMVQFFPGGSTPSPVEVPPNNPDTV